MCTPHNLAQVTLKIVLNILDAWLVVACGSWADRIGERDLNLLLGLFLQYHQVLSAVATYNYKLAKWLDEKLKPLSMNRHTISNILEFAEDLGTSKFNENTIMASYDVTAMFTNIPVDETIDILTAKLFQNNWFNVKHNLNITRSQLKQLLEMAAKNQLFQFNGQLYEQRDGVAMGSPLGPLMANSFLCHIEENLDQANKLLSSHK